MTRKLPPGEKKFRKLNWWLGRVNDAILSTTMSTHETTKAMVRLSVVLSGKTPAYNWPETPERSRMHAMYARKKGRA